MQNWNSVFAYIFVVKIEAMYVNVFVKNKYYDKIMHGLRNELTFLYFIIIIITIIV